MDVHAKATDDELKFQLKQRGLKVGGNKPELECTSALPTVADLSIKGMLFWSGIRDMAVILEGSMPVLLERIKPRSVQRLFTTQWATARICVCM